MSALMAVLMASVVVFGPYRQRWICLPLAACLVFFMVLTQSRTSFGALLVGLGTVVVASLLLDRQGLLKLRMRVSRFALVGLVAMASILALGYDLGTDQQLTKALITFAQKGKESETLSVEDVLASRQGMIDYMWANFLDSPMIGIGFEVSTHPYFAENATLFNAPIEKGFLPVAILEETGLVGTFFFVIFLLALAVNLIRTLNVPGLALFFAFLAVNCGESMFFSLGGHGAYGWLMMAAGMMLGQQSIVRIGTPLHSVNAAPPVAALQRTMMPTYGA
jgi:O-antigen ligase